VNSNILFGVIALFLGIWIWVIVELFNAPLVDENENIIDEDDIK
jgi:hypothetical protein